MYIRQKFVGIISVVTLSVVALLLGACSGSGSQVASATVVEALSFGDDQNFAQPTQPMEFEFPRDHGPHEAYRTEWWYYTGNLTADSGGEFGYQLTFFRTALTPDMPERASDLATNQIYLAHFALTDAAANRHESFERYARGGGTVAGAQGEPAFGVWLDAWSAKEVEPGVVQLEASAAGETGEVSISLRLEESGAPLLHGDQGLSQKGPEAGNANYYYSLVRQATTGTVTSGGESYSVHGLSWMDHEFGTSALSNNTLGWDWFAVTLDNGAVLMFGEFHDGSGGNRYVYEGTLSYPDGQRVSLGQGDFTLTVRETWQSPNTGIRYPAAWQVQFPEQKIELQITPIVADQEMQVSLVYYEGATMIEGTMNGEPVQGRGYVELTGYGDTRAGEEYRR